MESKFYITTSIAYTNAPPHGGYLLELLQADVLARYQRRQGKRVFFLTGTDEHGKKNLEAAKRANKTPQEFVDETSEQFRRLTKVFNISNDDFIRTSDEKRHWPAVVKLWNKLEQAGDLYKAKYEGFYCVGHEAFVKPSELENDKCPLHGQEPQILEEENWFFRLTKYKNELKKILAEGRIKILPENKTNEALIMLGELEDISFSRPSKDLPWGIPVPDDNTSRIYVWADALGNYLSAIGYNEETEQFKKLWPADIHLIGKDILKFHAVYWPAMLLSIGLPLPKAIYVHGFITVEGQKMSKTIGNVIDPFALVEKYGVDPVRYYLLREIPSNEDGDFSYKKLKARYNGDLANNLGNLVSRIAKLIETKLNGELIYQEKFLDKEVEAKIEQTRQAVAAAIDEFKLHEALAKIWELLTFANVYIDEHKPWADVQEHPDHFLKTIISVTRLVVETAKLLEPFLPETTEKILKTFSRSKGQEDNVFRVGQIEPLFPRLR